MTAVGFELTPLRNGALSHRLRPLTHIVWKFVFVGPGRPKAFLGASKTWAETRKCCKIRSSLWSGTLFRSSKNATVSWSGSFLLSRNHEKCNSLVLRLLKALKPAPLEDLKSIQGPYKALITLRILKDLKGS